jgi:hypothetical protein
MGVRTERLISSKLRRLSFCSSASAWGSPGLRGGEGGEEIDRDFDLCDLSAACQRPSPHAAPDTRT